jgi:TetR/AcrR family tetracycline transcriptional repressor
MRVKTVRKADAPVTRAVIVDAAFAVVNAHGIAGLNMRGIANALGVQAPTIYWHAGDKAELIRLMAAKIYNQAYAAAPDTDDWRLWLLHFGGAFRTSLLKHRDAAQICVMARPPIEDVEANAAEISAPLVKAGLNRADALSCLASVLSFTLGWACYQQSDAMHDYLSKMIDFDESFERGLNALIKGF